MGPWNNATWLTVQPPLPQKLVKVAELQDQLEIHHVYVSLSNLNLFFYKFLRSSLPQSPNHLFRVILRLLIMKLSLSLRCSLPLLVATVAFVGSILPVYGQVTTPCTASMISSISPCMMNLITNSSANGTSPTADCCNALKSLTSTGMDCACLIVTGNVPFQIPINRSLAISLPRACNMPGVPLQCKCK